MPKPRRPRVASAFFETEGVSVCKVCGCDDLHACANACSWASLDRETEKGVCSNCVGKKAPKNPRYGVVHRDGSYCAPVSGPKPNKRSAIRITVVAEGTYADRSQAVIFADALNRTGACKGAVHLVKQVVPKAKRKIAH